MDKHNEHGIGIGPFDNIHGMSYEDEDGVNASPNGSPPSPDNVLKRRRKNNPTLYYTQKTKNDSNRDIPADQLVAESKDSESPLDPNDVLDNKNINKSSFQFFNAHPDGSSSSSHSSNPMHLAAAHHASDIQPSTISMKIQSSIPAQAAANHKHHPAHLFGAVEPLTSVITVEKIKIGIQQTEETYADWEGVFTPAANPVDNLLHPHQLGTVTFTHQHRKNDVNNFSCDIYPDQIIAHQHTPFNAVAYEFMIKTLTANLPVVYAGVKPVAVIEILSASTNLDDIGMAKLVETIIEQGHVPLIPEPRMQAVLAQVKAQSSEKLEALLNILPSLSEEQANQTHIVTLRTLTADLLQPLMGEITLGEH